MITKSVFSVLVISVVLVQICWSKPVAETTDDDIAELNSHDLCLQKTKYDLEPSEKDNLLSPSKQLLKFTLKSFQEMSLQYVKKAKHISEQLSKSPELLSSQSSKIFVFRRNLTQFKGKYFDCADIQELFELVELYSNTTSDYFDLNEASLDDDDKLILSLLEKYGSKKLDEEALNMLNGFVDGFDKKFENLKENLAKEEGKFGKEMIKWFENFKALTDFDDKIDAFEQFFILYEDEDGIDLSLD